MLYHNIAELIGRTPLLSPDAYNRAYCHVGEVLCKLESFNPAGSAKDRVALRMLEDAEQGGRLSPGGTIIEPTSGNTGIGLSALAAARGYRLILTMPEGMSEERARLLRALGAELVLTPREDGMRGAIARAEALAAEIQNAWIPSQFENPSNPAAHKATTGPEIWEDCEGHVDVFVAGVGTGGTLSGVGAYLKEKNPNCRIVAVEPASSPMLSCGKSAPHGLQGIGANFVPANFDRALCDEIIPVREEEAYAAARAFAKAEGILIGISAGAALHAATLLANHPENRCMRIVALLPDGGERYLTTPLFEET